MENYFDAKAAGEEMDKPIKDGFSTEAQKEDTIDYDEVCDALFNQCKREVIELRDFLSGLSNEEIEKDLGEECKTLDRIFFTLEGLKQLGHVIGFLRAMQENGDIPKLSPTRKWAQDHKLEL